VALLGDMQVTGNIKLFNKGEDFFLFEVLHFNIVELKLIDIVLEVIVGLSETDRFGF
jgi:hypothetical protein